MLIVYRQTNRLIKIKRERERKIREREIEREIERKGGREKERVNLKQN